MDKVYNYLLKEVGFNHDDNVIVAVSGGPDSMALLNLMIKIKDKIKVNIICAHVNHNVRKESYNEAIEVEKVCRKNNVIFESMIIENYGDDNFHNEARSKRYNYFSEIIKKYNSKYLLTAHHADDLIETILMRIVRGSTLRGYSGFSKVLDLDEYKIIRPLIEVTKDQILNYNEENNIWYAIDSSNSKDIYTRNRYRKYIVPEFKKEDKNVSDKFYKFSKTLLECNNYIDKEVNKVILDIYKENILDIDKFIKLDNFIGMKIIYNILEKLYQDDLMLINDEHAHLIYNLIISKKGNSYIYLPNNIKAVKEYNLLKFTTYNEESNGYEIELIDSVNLPNSHVIEKISESTMTGNDVCYLNSEEIKLPIRIRTRIDGDRIYVKNMNGSRKVNDIFIDSKIKKADRDLWPIVVDSNDEIIWIPNLKKSKFDKTKTKNYDIILRYY